MRKIDLFRAIPRPLGQFLAVALVWPLWFLCGAVEAMFPNTGAIVQAQIESGLAAIPPAGWATISAIAVAGHWSRSKDKDTKRKAAEALAQLKGES